MPAPVSAPPSDGCPSPGPFAKVRAALRWVSKFAKSTPPLCAVDNPFERAVESRRSRLALPPSLPRFDSVDTLSVQPPLYDMHPGARVAEPLPGHAPHCRCSGCAPSGLRFMMPPEPVAEETPWERPIALGILTLAEHRHQVIAQSWVIFAPVGVQFPREHFRGTPQESAINTLHLREYLRTRERAERECPYAVLPSQLALLIEIGMEVPTDAAPSVPHGFHKNLEESQLRRLATMLPAEYGLISLKTSKTKLLPAPLSHQNPVMESKDVSRYPESTLARSSFRMEGHKAFLLHDVSSVVGPHELVERLVQENPQAHLYVTGVNPHEALHRHYSFYPNSHRIKYSWIRDRMTWSPHSSESESYTQPISITCAWLQTSAVMASNGVRYLVTLKDYRYGHCIWHIYAGDEAEEEVRAFPTGKHLLIPARFTGTLRDEWINRDFVTGMMSFGERTPVRLESNYLAKANGLASRGGAHISARSRWVGSHLCRSFDPYRSWTSVAVTTLYHVGLFVTLQWGPLFRDTRDIYELIAEDSTADLVECTCGGGWSPPRPSRLNLLAIRNYPTVLEQFSVLTGFLCCFIVPKVALGSALTVFWHTDFTGAARAIWEALGMSVDRLLLTTAIAAITAALPNEFTGAVARLAEHFYRQMWLPGQLFDYFLLAVVELSGAPGYRILPSGPGRGWLWQLGLWLFAGHEIFVSWVPGGVTLVGSHTFLNPYAAVAHPAMTLFWLAWISAPFWGYAWHNLRLPRGDPGPFPAYSSADLTRQNIGAVARAQAHHLWLRLRYACAARPTPSVGVQRHDLGPPIASITPPAPIVPGGPPLATIVVQPPLPTGGPRGTGYVDPQGLTFRDWLQAVEAAYQQLPGRYPPLTQNRSCFYDSVSQLAGGTAHMWWSWHMAAENVLPGNVIQPFGETNVAGIGRFCALAGFPYDMTGVQEQSAPGSSGWPTLFLTISRNADTTQHCTPRIQNPLSPAIGYLAAILASMRRTCNDWVLEDAARVRAAPNAAVLQPSPWALAVAPGLLPATLTKWEYDAAFRASGHIRGFIPGQTGVFWDHGLYPSNRRLPDPPALWPRTVLLVPAAGQVRGPEPVPTPIGHSPAPRPPRPMRGVPRACPPDRGGTPPAAAPPPTAPPSQPREEAEPAENRPAPSTTQGGAEPTSNPRKYRDAFGVKMSRKGLTDDTTPIRGPQPVVPTYSRVHELRSELVGRLGPDPGRLPVLHLEPEVIAWQPDFTRALWLAEDLAGKVDLMGPRGDLNVARSHVATVKSLMRTGKNRTIKVTLLFGVFGCGKTTAMKKMLKAMTPDERANSRIVSHTPLLRAQMEAACSQFTEMRGFNFPTLPNILSEPSCGTIFFDDAGKFWGGLLDLVVLCNPLVDHVVINGDPAQGRSRIPLPGAQSYRLPNMAKEMSQLATKYATVSHRSFRTLSDTLGIYTTSTEVGHITFVTSPAEKLAITSSPRYVQVLDAAGADAVTFADVQGEEFDEEVELDITGLETAIRDSPIYVGLSRSKKGAYIHGEALAPSRVKNAPTGSDLLNAILYDLTLAQATQYRPDDGIARRCFYAHLQKAIPNLPWFQRVGYAAQPETFQLHVPMAHHLDPIEADCHDATAAEPTAHLQPVCEALDHEIAPLDRDYREVFAYGQMTSQFRECAVINPPVHHRADDATYKMGIARRLTPGSVEANQRRMDTCPREEMIAMFDILVANPPSYPDSGERSMDTAALLYAERRSELAVLAHLASHDPDRTGSDVKLSEKNQTVRKLEKVRCEAIPPQIIHEYDIGSTLADAPVAQFLEDELLPAFASNVTFYHRESVPELIQRLGPRLHTGRGYSGSDVSRWDTGCDAGVLNFDAHVMRRCRVPEEFIESYVRRRLSTRSQYGVMQTMQNSGDRFTWCMNSIRRAVLSCIQNRVEPQFGRFVQTTAGAKYLKVAGITYVKPSSAHSEQLVVVNGDDDAVDDARQDIPPDDPFHAALTGFPDSTYVFKNQHGPSVEFSGLEFRPHGRIAYSSYGLYWRCLIKEETRTTDPIQWRAYLDLFSSVDAEDPFCSEIARLLLRNLPAQDVVERAHPSLQHHVATIASARDYSDWKSAFIVPHPPKTNFAFK